MRVLRAYLSTNRSLGLGRIGSRLQMGRDLRSDGQILGVYFDDAAVSVAWLDRHAGRSHLLAARQVPCQGAISQGQITDKPKIAQAIKDACAAIGVPSLPVIGCVADEAVMTTTIELPAVLSDEDIEAEILIDAERYIGRALDAVYFDFQIVDANAAATRVALTVAHRTAVDDCVEVLAMAGLEAEAIDVAALCIAHMARQLGARSVAALIDVDAWQVRCHIAKQSFMWEHSQSLDPLLASRVLPADHVDDVPLSKPSEATDALDFTGFVHQRQASDETDGGHEDGAYQIGFDVPHWHDDPGEITPSTEHLPDAIEPDTIDRMANQITVLLDRYRQQYTEPIDRVYLLGLDAGCWAGLDRAVMMGGVESCQFAHPGLLLDTSMMLGAAIDEASAPALMMSVMLGLRAEDGINLLPWRDDKRIRAAMQFRRMLQAAILVPVLMTLAVFAFLNHKISHQNAINAEITAKIAATDEQLQQIQQLKTQLNNTEEKLAAIDALATDRATLHRWQSLPLMVPDGVYLDSAKHTGEEVLWTGKAVHAEAVSAFANALELSGMYADVLVVSLQGAERAMSFSISATELPLAPEDMQLIVMVDAANFAEQDAQQEDGDE